MKYNHSTIAYHRVITKPVQVGHLTIGQGHPIRIQSMTNTDTDNIDATFEQIKQLADIGCEIVRITVPSIKAAESTEKIVNRLKQANINVPIVADIHFTPNAAMKVMEYVEKVRINPGNYVDKKKFEVLTYSDEQYQSEINRIEDKFAPLVEKALKYNRAMRIGTNHGSLSDRIMNRYGDSPEGMVESAWEFAEICRKMDYHNFIFSMKASNPQVMIQAYRLLQNRMFHEDAIYPLHLGVTEAGDGIDGRIKSYAGIGALLDDGLGDTIRVSLTENPLKEVPVARELADYYNSKKSEQSIPFEETRNPIHFHKRETITISGIGDSNLCKVFLNTSKNVSELSDIDIRSLTVFDLQTNVKADHFILNVEDEKDINQIVQLLSDGVIQKEQVFICLKSEIQHEFLEEIPLIIKSTLAHLSSRNLDRYAILEIDFDDSPTINILDNLKTIKLPKSLVLTVAGNATTYLYRMLAELFPENPILLNGKDLSTDIETYRMKFSTQAGSLLCDGIGNGLIMDSNYDHLDNIKLAFTILQGTRTRISKTEYISCPSCGRTLFDLEETTAMIKSHTSHLKGVKIAVMGCIVNGPGEMADADFGYVGSGPGKINLYVGQDLVKRNIKSDNAVNELVDLIKSHNLWVEPS